MRQLRYDYRDIACAPGIAWSYRKMYLAFRGIVLAWFVYDVFAYLALLFIPSARALGPTGLFRYHELFPCIMTHPVTAPALVIWIAGLVSAAYILLSAASSVCMIAFEDLRGNDIVQPAEARSFIRARRPSIILPVFAPIIALSAAVVFAVMAGLVVRIPWIGPPVFALSLPVMFVMALAGVFSLWMLLNASGIVPSVAGTTGEDALEVLMESALTVLGRPLKTIAYTMFGKLITLVSTAVFACAVLAALVLIHALSAVSGGFVYGEMFTVSLYRIPFLMQSDTLIGTLILLGRMYILPLPVDTLNSSLPVLGAGWIMGILHLLVISLIFSYAFSCFYCTQAILYLIIRRQRSGDDLRERIPRMSLERNSGTS